MKKKQAKPTAKVRRNPPPPPRRERHAPGAETLAAAALAVHDVVFEGRSSDAALEDAHERQDRAAVRAIALGTLRWYLRLKPALAPLVNRPFDELSPRLAALLVTTAHQVEYSAARPKRRCTWRSMRAACSAKAAPAAWSTPCCGGSWPIARTLLAAADEKPAQRHAHPQWLVEALRAAWGERPTRSSMPTTSTRRWC
jgi:16S rRNA (cytosine967-C5)-methyltransferase